MYVSFVRISVLCVCVCLFLIITADGMFSSDLLVPSSTKRCVILSYSSSVLSTSTTAVGMVEAMASRRMVAVLSVKKNYPLDSCFFSSPFVFCFSSSFFFLSFCSTFRMSGLRYSFIPSLSLSGFFSSHACMRFVVDINCSHCYFSLLLHQTMNASWSKERVGVRKSARSHFLR